MCFCQYDDPNFGFKSDSGLYCCQKTKEQCKSQYLDIIEVTCTREVLNLTQQCHNECNFYGFDIYRNNYNNVGNQTIRSYLDICQDNRYELNSQFLSILLIMNNTHKLFSELVLMKLNCVRESHYV